MEVNQRKQRMFADFSIDTLLRKEEVKKTPMRKDPWGIVKQHNDFLTTITTAVPVHLGESYYNCPLSSTSNCCGEASCDKIPENASLTPQASSTEDVEEFISVSDDDNKNKADNDIKNSCKDFRGQDLNYGEDSPENTFAWLACTRFKPPKLHRPKRKSILRRGRGPRIPFSTHQLAILENTFLTSQYLSSDAIMKLADNLNLTETRVKIWFQNRRARFRREKNLTSSFTPGKYHQTESSDFPAIRQPNVNVVPPTTDYSLLHPLSSLTKKQSFRHLINDLNLMAAGAVIHPSSAKKSSDFLHS